MRNEKAYETIVNGLTFGLGVNSKRILYTILSPTDTESAVTEILTALTDMQGWEVKPGTRMNYEVVEREIRSVSGRYSKWLDVV